MCLHINHHPRKWKAFFDNVARLVSGSIADVECKHAQSQHWADRPFPTMVAKHLNAEFKVHKSEAQHQLACQIGKLDKPGPATANAGHMRIGEVTVKMKQKQMRKKSAYMFFRDDWIKAQKECSGAVVNPASKEFWAELKQRFSELNPDMLQYYQELSEKSGLDANQKRHEAAATSGLAASSSSADSQQLSNVNPTLQNLPMNPWIADSGQVDSQNSWDGISKQIVEACQLSVASPELLRDDVHSQSPISEDMLERAWRKQLQDGETWASTLLKFDSEAQQFSEPSAQGPFFPKQVFYQGHCGCFCRRHNPSAHVQFFTQLTTAFTDLVKRLGPIGVVNKMSILLQFDLSFSNSAVTNVYAWLVAPAAKSGIHRPQQSFILCTADTGVGPRVFNLTLKTLPLCESSRSWAQSGMSAGSLHQLDHESFAVHLLDLQPHNACVLQDVALEKISIHRLRFEDVGLATVQVLGFDPGFETIVVKMFEDVPQEPSGLLVDGCDDAVPGVILDDEECDNVPSEPSDLLGLMCADVELEKTKFKKRRTTAKSKADIQAEVAKARSAQGTYKSIYVVEDDFQILEPEPARSADDLLHQAVDDPSVVESLDPDVAQSLTQALWQCKQHHQPKVDTSCTFDLEPDQFEEASESLFDLSGENDVDNAASSSDSRVHRSQDSEQVGFAAPPDVPPDAKHPVEANARQSVFVDQSTQEIVLSRTDAKTLKLIHHKEPKFGNLVCEMREQHHPSGIHTPVGRVNLLLGKDRASYKAHCSIHKSCQCWVQSTDGRLLDQLVDWLAAAPNSTPIEHDKLSKELRRSLGMKVRD